MSKALFKKISQFLTNRRDNSDSDETPAGKWSIGVYAGTSPLRLNSPETIVNPVLTAKDVTDASANFVADPFMIKADSTWHMFFETEVLNAGEENKGKIGLATSKDGFHWKYEKIILDEPFHLSYPYVFKWENEYYLIPETRKLRSVRLYKATDFPTKWVFEKTLIKKKRYADSSVFQYNGHWWMFTESGHSTLRLYYANSLLDAWTEHPKSPVIKKNPSIARPGGRVITFDNQIIRYTQDAYPHYGRQVWAFRITELTTTSYKEEQACGEIPIITASGAGWNKLGMHHIDPHLLDDNQWFACVDGFGEPEETCEVSETPQV
ncbi:glucosamine inositolphosphorylceramide transferase family protein [Desulfonema magnum]|uniref:glucosamine inositolphosphorylceramide transferase family protein n=1 Tax=Desulfonema magnum TaxID=45655 RepID=UPI001A9C0B26|nr:hypothetical protein [Desulfonema magnum]